MALETLKGVKELGGFVVMAERPKKDDGSTDWEKFDEQRKSEPVYIDHEKGMISFRIQDGPVKEKGVNGCQVGTLIHAAYEIIAGLNKQFPCRENSLALTKLEEALMWLQARTKNRERRGVEGSSQP